MRSLKVDWDCETARRKQYRDEGHWGRGFSGGKGKLRGGRGTNKVIRGSPRQPSSGIIRTVKGTANHRVIQRESCCLEVAP